MNDILLKGKFYAKLKGIIFFLSLAVIYSSCEKRQDKYSTQLNKDPLNEILESYKNEGTVILRRINCDENTFNKDSYFKKS